MKNWYKSAYRRILVDSHIVDWDPVFYSKFNMDEFVETMCLAHHDAVMLETRCHVGNCYYPTKVGHMHSGLKGMDVFGGQVKRFYKNGIKVMASYVTTYDNWAYNSHPEWRQVYLNGKSSRDDGSRYGKVCLNSSYKDFVLAQVKEIVSNYNIEHFFFDMNYYDHVCYCEHCKRKHMERFGREIPMEVDWEDPKWIEFIRWREEIVYNFTKDITDTVKSINPNVTVNHQFLPLHLCNWENGQPLKQAGLCDFMGIDASFCTDLFGQSLLCKFWRNLTNNMPFELHITKHPHHGAHTHIKSLDKLKAHAFTAIANGGAMHFIDAINPDGTLNRLAYERMGEVFDEIEDYLPYVGGEPIKSVAVYFSKDSARYYDRTKGRVDETWSIADVVHVKGLLGACKTLFNANIPYDVITKRNLNELNKYQVLILPNAICLDNDEINAFTDFVKKGGGLVATRKTSLMDTDGHLRKDFGLGQVLGVSYISDNVNYPGKTLQGIVDGGLAINLVAEEQERPTYIRRVVDKEPVLCIIPNMPLMLNNGQVLVKCNSGEVIAKVSLPYPIPEGEVDNFSSIHSDPSGVDTDYPAIVLGKYGKGKTCYISGVIEAMDFDEARGLFIDIVKYVMKGTMPLESNAPACVEVNGFHQKNKDRTILHVVNFQNDIPMVTVHNLKITLQIPYGKRVNRVQSIPDGKRIKYIRDGQAIKISLPPVKIYSMVMVEYR